MRRNTALKVLAGGYVFILLGSLASEEGRENIPALLFSGLVVGFFLYMALLRDRPRRRSIQDEARRLGLSFSPDDPFRTLDLPFSLFRRTAKSYGELTNVLWGGWHGLEVRVFDYSYSESEDQVRRYSCAMAAIPGGWPGLVIRPESMVTTAADHLGLPDLAFESELFNRAFEVRCRDRGFANAVIDARMMEWMLGLTSRPGFEIQGRWILGYRDQVYPWEIDSVLAMLTAFIDRIPPVVRSLFPEAMPPRPDLTA